MVHDEAKFDCRQHAGHLSDQVNASLRKLFPPGPPVTLYEPAQYVLDAGGKRFRPVIFLLAARSLGVGTDAAMPAALAIEVFHNFTLVHDDIMDHADERRGRPTVHRRWDESIAILSGDLLLARSYGLLAELPPERLAPALASFNKMVIALCEGQALDKEFESRANVSVDEYLDMIGKKTGALLAFALEAAGILAGAQEETIGALRSAGMKAGIGFQIQDDLLDLTAESDQWGKTIGGDLIEGKKTYILLRAIEQGQGGDAKRLRQVLERGGVERGDIPATVAAIRRTGALDDAGRLVGKYYDGALRKLSALPDNLDRKTLHWILERLRGRSH